MTGRLTVYRKWFCSNRCSCRNRSSCDSARNRIRKIFLLLPDYSAGSPAQSRSGPSLKWSSSWQIRVKFTLFKIAHSSRWTRTRAASATRRPPTAGATSTSRTSARTRGPCDVNERRLGWNRQKDHCIAKVPRESKTAPCQRNSLNETKPKKRRLYKKYT